MRIRSSYSPLSSRGPPSSFEKQLLIVFGVFYLLAALYLRRYHSWRDPGSIFFSIARAYEPVYTVVRQEQADQYIASNPTYDKSEAESPPNVCVGIATVAREKVRYFHTTVGSVLHGLSPAERRRIHLASFIADSDPARHPAYSEAWLHDVSDSVLTYKGVPGDHLARLQMLEAYKAFQEKALLDYTFLMKHCITTEAPYIVMIEDDVVMEDGWLHRTEQALTEIAASSKPDHLYLRIFWTEYYFGWNREYWPKYLFWSVLITSIPAALLIGARRYAPKTNKHITDRTIQLVCFVCVPLCILLYFAAGGVTMQPMPTGLLEMNKFGCCSQGLVFPREKAGLLVAWYEAHQTGFVDALTEQYADAHHEMRYAISPPVLQHVGIRSSKNNDIDRIPEGWVTPANKLWNFAYELQDPKELEADHQRATSEEAA